MACDCKIKLEKELRENGYHLARLSGLFAFVGNQMQFKPTIEVVYYKKKKDGSYVRANLLFRCLIHSVRFVGRSLKKMRFK